MQVRAADQSAVHLSLANTSPSQAVTLAGNLIRQHLVWLLAAVGLAIIIGVGFWWRAKQKPPINADRIK